jgi:hypothetical protein
VWHIVFWFRHFCGRGNKYSLFEERPWLTKIKFFLLQVLLSSHTCSENSDYMPLELFQLSKLCPRYEFSLVKNLWWVLIFCDLCFLLGLLYLFSLFFVSWTLLNLHLIWLCHLRILYPNELFSIFWCCNRTMVHPSSLIIKLFFPRQCEKGYIITKLFFPRQVQGNSEYDVG